jgi:tetratricopeptide (TPR) repeat protein
MKYILLFMMLLAAHAQAAHAQKKTFVRDYTYQASELDSKVSARTNATTEMRNILLREIGEFLHTERKSVSGAYSETIEAITAGIVEMKVLNEQWDGATYYIKAEMTVDAADVNRRIAELLNDKQKTKDLEEARIRTRALELEVKRLQTALAEQKKLAESRTAQAGKTPAEVTTALQTAYQQQMEQLSIEEYFIEGEYAFEKKDYDTAIDYYLKAISINPKNATAYNKLAYAYDRKSRKAEKNDANKDKYKALARQYYLKALEFNPNNFSALYAIQSRYWKKDYDLYFSCSRKLIALEPDNVTLRKKIIDNIMGDIYSVNTQRRQQVITWCKELIAIDPIYTDYAYYNISEVYESCHVCRNDANYRMWKKEFEEYKHNFLLQLARKGNEKVREWFRANGKSWIE